MFFCVDYSFSPVNRFAHPETGRDFAAKAANYFQKSARKRGGGFESLNTEAQRNADKRNEEIPLHSEFQLFGSFLTP